MNKSLFNEPELYLLNNWSGVRALEQSMEILRGKYQQTFEKILNLVQSEYPELDARSIRITNGGQVCMAKSTWPLRYGPTWPPGFWIECISLEHLISDEVESPYAAVWLQPPKGMVLADAKDKLFEAAKQIMADSELIRLKAEAKRSSASLWYPLPETRQALLKMLLANGARPFIDCMVAHFENLARFVPVVDEIYAVKSSGKHG